MDTIKSDRYEIRSNLGYHLKKSTQTSNVYSTVKHVFRVGHVLTVFYTKFTQ